MVEILIPDVAVKAILVVPPLLGLLWSFFAWNKVVGIKLVAPTGGSEPTNKLSEPLTEGANSNAPLKRTMTPQQRDDCVSEMKRIAGIIEDGAITFLKAEYKVMFAFIVIFSVLLTLLTNKETTVAFVAGSCTSILCGWLGMMIAVKTNVKTAHAAWDTLGKGFDVALVGGSVMGLSLVSIGVLGLLLVVFGLQKLNGEMDQLTMYECVAGYGLGGSAIALFGRVGGGIYTKAADVGADLAGKCNEGLEEDDIRNPATIADNVGDNVGDIAGMGADLFGSFAESTCAALVLASSSEDLRGHWASIMYPILVSTSGIVVGMLTLLVRGFCCKVETDADVEKALKGVLIISTVLMTPVVITLSYVCLPSEFTLNAETDNVQWWYCALSIVLGLWSGLIIGYVTEYYTSSTYAPVRSIAETQKQSAATGVIMGLAVGYVSCIIPTFCLGISVLVAHTLVGMFGVALAALGMLGTLTMGLTIDAYGPISDNAGGIAEMTLDGEEGEGVRARTDCLDAAGNTTAAIGKGFAIGSAALVSLALFGAFCVRAEVKQVDILDPWVFTGLLFGAMMPYAFAAWTMQSVGLAADEMVKECDRQFKLGILEKDTKLKPDYERCIKISTDASLWEMIAPGALVILSPIVAGFGFGKNTCAGMLSGALVSSVQLAISMSNTGGAWDNSKKYISAGNLGEGFRKGSEAHMNSVTGDTVGDPLKDTSGPALNIVMKLTAIISLVFGTAIKDLGSNAQGGPAWLK